MSKSPLLDPDGSIEDLSDEQLLERIANLDPEEYPLARVAKRALEHDIAQGDSS
ncbi:hypothetical protein [Haloplanus halophilus]|uniref:hypothetical protein n=1 Tax=Haloplanus halophilus TaxID=2949993 RepID=UPI00203B09E2|nr:hypothetical protein [Haloplanus sp. GDY1]